MQNGFIVHFFGLALIILAHPGIQCQETFVPMGKSGGLAASTVAVPGFWSVSDNLAGLSEQQDAAAGIFWGNPYGIPELANGAVAIAFPTAAGVVAGLYSQSGYSLCKQQRLGLGYSRTFSKVISAGLRLDYLSETFGEGYGKCAYLSFSLGAIAKANEKLNIGASLDNPYGFFLQKQVKEDIIPVLRLGMKYTFSDEFYCTLEARKTSGLNPEICGGLDYTLSELASVRIGISNAGSQKQENPVQGYLKLAFGACLNWNKLTLDLNSSFHQVLGWSPDISVAYAFK